MIIILITSLWLHQLLSSWWWPSHPLTMLGTGRHSLWNICRQWKTTMLKGFAASRGRGQRREELRATAVSFSARSCPGGIANLQSHPGQEAWLNAGQALSPVALGSSVSCLASQSVSYCSYTLGMISWQGNSIGCNIYQHVYVTLQGSPSPSPMYIIVTHHILKWILWFVRMLSA